MTMALVFTALRQMKSIRKVLYQLPNNVAAREDKKYAKLIAVVQEIRKENAATRKKLGKALADFTGWTPDPKGSPKPEKFDRRANKIPKGFKKKIRREIKRDKDAGLDTL